MPKSKKARSIIVTVADEALHDVKGLADRLTAKGMTVHRVMPITGIISGSCDSAKVSNLKKMKGVTAVEDEVGVQLPSPDSAVQ